MSWASVAVARVRGMLARSRPERELEDEIRFHLDMQVETNQEAGMDPQEARYAALRSFGAVEPMKEQYRDRLSLPLVETALQDVRYAVRTLRKGPSYTIASVATLALAIGANTAMFSVLNTVLLQPLPYQAPEQLAMLWSERPDQNLREGRSGYWNVQAWRQSKSFADMAFFDGVSLTLTDAESADRVTAVRVSPNFFSLLGVQPVAGRMFSAEEAEQRQPVALISYRFWQTRFGGSLSALSQTIELDGLTSRVIGVLPRDFRFPRVDPDVWEPHTRFADWEVRRAVRGEDTWSVVGRLRPGVSFQQAQAEMSAIARGLDEQMPPSERNRGIRVVPLDLHVLPSKTRLALWMLAAAVFCVLLIAGSNVASLALVRSINRSGELAIRAALGATKGRIVRQLLAEGITLAVVSGAAGLLLAVAAIRFIQSLDTAALGLPPRLSEVSMDLRVLGAALAISLFAGILIGLAPALAVRHRDLRTAIGDHGRSLSGGTAAHRLRRALVTAEFALAIVLLVAAGLLVRSWHFIDQVDPGFQPERVLTMQIRTPVRMPSSQRVQFHTQVLANVKAVPGVESAALTSDLFISLTREQTLTLEGGSSIVPLRLQVRRDEVSAEFFRAAGAPLLRGRFFTDADGPGSPRVVIVNDALAGQLWPAADPIGRRFKFGSADSEGPWFAVVGVVADMRRQGVERQPVPQIFEALTQNPPGGGSLVVRTSVDNPLSIAADVQAAVRSVEKYAPIYDVSTLEAQLAEFLAPRRLQTLLVVCFSGIALLMAAIGIYGLIQYSIATRTKEIGIRMALGAHAGDIFRMILGEGFRLSLIGLTFGLVAAYFVGRASSSLLFGVTGTDPLTFAGVALLLIAVAAAACYFPARRATKVEPVLALRQQ